MTKAELEAGLAAVAAGDPNALAELYRAYYQPVFLLAASLTGDAALAEDTVQEVFLTVQTCAGRYRPGTNGRAWLFGVTRNVARWQLRRAHYDTMDEEEPDDLPATGGTETGCLETMLVGEALRVLSAGEYPVVVLHVFAGLKLTEIARYLDIPYGTVLWRYSEGKKKLKRYYEQLDKGERRETHVG